MEMKWKENLITLGTFGRAEGAKVTQYQDITGQSGVVRPEGSKAMEQAHQYLVGEMKAIGLEVYYDQVGNLFGRRPGKQDVKSVSSGSHIDTVLNAGQFDGTFGVIAALEALRRLEAEKFENERPIEMVVFMGEEGSGFQESLLGSSVLGGQIPAQDALAQKDTNGVTLKEIVQKTFKEEIREKNMAEDTEYFIESHIEQGGRLDSMGIDIGCVQGIAGLRGLRISIEGQENHAGSTPMNLRKTPITPLAELAIYAHNIALEIAGEKGSTVATVDTIGCKPGSYSVIPHIGELTLDLRDSTQEKVDHLSDLIIQKAYDLGEKYGVKVQDEVLTNHAPCTLDEEIFETILQSTQDLGYSNLNMYSGAIHDALNIASIVKTGMLFVPSKDGISHSPFEWTDWEDQEKGIHVLTQVLKTLSTRV